MFSNRKDAIFESVLSKRSDKNKNNKTEQENYFKDIFQDIKEGVDIAEKKKSFTEVIKKII